MPKVICGTNEPHDRLGDDEGPNPGVKGEEDTGFDPFAKIDACNNNRSAPDLTYTPDPDKLGTCKITTAMNRKADAGDYDR